MEKTKITDDMRIKLRADFPKEAYKQHPTKTFLTTLKAMYVVERLNDVLGVGRWGVKTDVAERTGDYITLKGAFYSLDYEIAIPEQFGGHSTTGTNTEIADGYKSAVTDCISKLASYLEVGISMFKGEIEPSGKPTSKTDSKNTFGDNGDDALKWINDTSVKAMITSISEGKKQNVIDALPLYKWSNKNKELITKELDNEKK